MQIAPSAWASANLVVPDGPRAGSTHDMSLTPYVAEPLDKLGPDSGGKRNRGHEVGADRLHRLLLIALLGHLVDRALAARW